MLTLEQMTNYFHVPIPFNRNEFTVVCPKCKKKKMHINLEREVFNCYSCNTGGGAIDFWALCRGLEGPKLQVREMAKKDFFEVFNGNAEKEFKSIQPKAASGQNRKRKVLNRQQKDKTYSELFGLLKLNPEHKKALMKRGFTEEQIEFFGFKSYPEKEDLFRIPEKLLKKGCILNGVAGFYKENGNWRLVDYPSGIIIPQKGLDGMIRSFQVRQDKTAKNKYLSISSGRYEKSFGTKGIATFHYATNDINARALNLIITEGPLKGDLIFTRTEIPVLAIQGVNSTRMLKDCLLELHREKGLRNIFLAFDMDKHENPFVSAGVKNISETISEIYDEDKLESVLREANKLEESELTEEQKNKARLFRVVEWEWANDFKGLDDYLV